MFVLGNIKYLYFKTLMFKLLMSKIQLNVSVYCMFLHRNKSFTIKLIEKVLNVVCGKNIIIKLTALPVDRII